MGDKRKVDEPTKPAAPSAKATKRSKSTAQNRPLPQTRAELMELHRETRARRNAAGHGSEEHVDAIRLIERIEIEIARIERAMDPPLG
jgi:hypothetical protein